MKKEKTLGDLAKEFPNKTYIELEKYKNADRQAEAGACIMGEMRKDREKITDTSVLIDTYEKEIWKLKELLSRALQDTNTLEGTKRIVIDLSKEKIVLKKRAEEAEGELSILKGIETNRVKEAQAKSNQLQDELDRVKRENNDLFNRVADSLEVDESHQKLNGKLQERLTELEEENKKMHAKLDERIDSMRKSGM